MRDQLDLGVLEKQAQAYKRGRQRSWRATIFMFALAYGLILLGQPLVDRLIHPNIRGDGLVLTAGLPLVIMVGTLIAVMLRLNSLQQPWAANSRKADAILREIWPELPTTPIPPWNQYEIAYLVVMTLLLFVIFSWQNIGIAIGFAILSAVISIYSHGLARRLTSFAQAAGHLIPTVVFYGVFSLAIAVSSWMDAPVVAPALVLAWGGYTAILPAYRIRTALRAGRHSEVEQRVNSMLRWYPDTANVIQSKGATLLFAGKLEESEAVCRQLYIDMPHGSLSLKATLLNPIGMALSYQGRFAEGLRFVECALLKSPNMMAFYLNLAEIYVQAGTEAHRALDILEAGERSTTATPVTRSLMQGVRGWALALLGQYAEAEASIERSFSSVPKNSIIFQAALHYMAAQVQLLKGEREKAAEHFRQAVALDTGLYGQRAAKALAELEAAAS
jgi:tetratricopeptide (TPR) repeat protein